MRYCIHAIEVGLVSKYAPLNGDVYYLWTELVFDYICNVCRTSYQILMYFVLNWVVWCLIGIELIVVMWYGSVLIPILTMNIWKMRAFNLLLLTYIINILSYY